MYDEAFQNLLKFRLSFGGGLDGSNEEKNEGGKDAILSSIHSHTS